MHVSAWEAPHGKRKSDAASHIPDWCNFSLCWSSPRRYDIPAKADGSILSWALCGGGVRGPVKRNILCRYFINNRIHTGIHPSPACSFESKATGAALTRAFLTPCFPDPNPTPGGEGSASAPAWHHTARTHWCCGWLLTFLHSSSGPLCCALSALWWKVTLTNTSTFVRSVWIQTSFATGPTITDLQGVKQCSQQTFPSGQVEEVKLKWPWNRCSTAASCTHFSEASQKGSLIPQLVLPQGLLQVTWPALNQVTSRAERTSLCATLSAGEFFEALLRGWRVNTDALSSSRLTKRATRRETEFRLSLGNTLTRWPWPKWRQMKPESWA